MSLFHVGSQQPSLLLLIALLCDVACNNKKSSSEHAIIIVSPFDKPLTLSVGQILKNTVMSVVSSTEI